MGDSLCDMFLKEHEKFLPIHGMIQASAVKPKTPYQLDLEVKDRKPDIIPKVGDRVKIKSREWYEKWKDTEGRVWLNNAFTPPMADFCGKILKIRSGIGSFYSLEGNGWSWHPGMFEEVYPVQAQLCSKFPRIDLSSTLPLEGTLQAKEGELIVRNMDFRSMIEETAKKLTAYTLVQGASAKPKLKQVKTTHLIKLKKL